MVYAPLYFVKFYQTTLTNPEFSGKNSESDYPFDESLWPESFQQHKNMLADVLKKGKWGQNRKCSYKSGSWGQNLAHGVPKIGYR